MKQLSLEAVTYAYRNDVKLWDGADDRMQIRLMNEVAGMSARYGQDIPAEIFSFAVHGVRCFDRTEQDMYYELVEDFSAPNIGHVFATNPEGQNGPAGYMAFDGRYTRRDPLVRHYDRILSPLQFRIKRQHDGIFAGAISLGAFSITRQLNEKGVSILGDVLENDAVQLMRAKRNQDVSYPYYRERALISWRNDIPDYLKPEPPTVYAAAAQQVADAERLIVSDARFSVDIS